MRRFLLIFLPVLVLLEIPWPAVGAGYRAFFQALTRATLCASTERREVTLETLRENGHGLNDTRFVIVNPSLMMPDGSGPVRNLDFPTKNLGWDPSVLVVALVLATPGTTRRRFWGILAGLLAVHGYAILALTFAVWNESAAVSLMTPPAGWSGAMNRLEQALITQLALAVPVMAWVIAAFRFPRRHDSTVTPAPAGGTPLAHHARPCPGE